MPPSTKEPRSRIPPSVDGIQVNFCKNPTCRTFGVPPDLYSRKGRPQLGDGAADVSGACFGERWQTVANASKRIEGAMKRCWICA